MPGKTNAAFESRIRLLHGGKPFFGPGKADLLDWIGQTGSIRRAANKMDMSYNRAWLLVKAMNQEFLEPLVVQERGGAGGGGAALTAAGREVLKRYRRMNAASRAAAAADWDKLRGKIR
jgi:molybdate transport system regulatory protein